MCEKGICFWQYISVVCYNFLWSICFVASLSLFCHYVLHRFQNGILQSLYAKHEIFSEIDAQQFKGSAFINFKATPKLLQNLRIFREFFFLVIIIVVFFVLSYFAGFVLKLTVTWTLSCYSFYVVVFFSDSTFILNI